MKSVILAGIPEALKKELRGDFISSKLIRKRLTEVIKDKVENNRDSLRQKKNYELSSWAYEQADGVGYERALFEIISLLED